MTKFYGSENVAPMFPLDYRIDQYDFRGEPEKGQPYSMQLTYEQVQRIVDAVGGSDGLKDGSEFALSNFEGVNLLEPGKEFVDVTFAFADNKNVFFRDYRGAGLAKRVVSIATARETIGRMEIWLEENKGKASLKVTEKL